MDLVPVVEAVLALGVEVVLALVEGAVLGLAVEELRRRRHRESLVYTLWEKGWRRV